MTDGQSASGLWSANYFSIDFFIKHSRITATSRRRDRRSRRRLRVTTIINRRRRPVMTLTRAKTENQTTIANYNLRRRYRFALASPSLHFFASPCPPPFPALLPRLRRGRRIISLASPISGNIWISLASNQGFLILQWMFEVL